MHLRATPAFVGSLPGPVAATITAAALACVPGPAAAAPTLIGDQLLVQLRAPTFSTGAGGTVSPEGFTLERPEGVFSFSFTDTTIVLNFRPADTSNPAPMEDGLELQVDNVDNEIFGVALDAAYMNAGLGPSDLSFDASSFRLALGGKTFYADQPYALTLDFTAPVTLPEPAPLALVVLALCCLGWNRRLVVPRQPCPLRRRGEILPAASAR